MLLSCNVDCGEVLPGYRLVARGLRDDGFSNDSLNGDYMGHYEGKPVERVVSWVYALIPGLSQPEHGANGLDVDASVALDPPPDPGVWGPVLALGANAREDQVEARQQVRSVRSSSPRGPSGSPSS